ncbi:MAG: YfiR family protein [Planctomycetes bacterium]|nr:YfiR family protein [Planctomycetota bacterium]
MRLRPRSPCSVRIALACACLALATLARESPAHLDAAAQSSAQAGQSEYQVKAAVLFKFVGYVKWPEKAFKDASDPIVVAVVGPDPFGSLIDNAFKDKLVGGRKLVVKRFKTTADIERCHVLFVVDAESPKLPQILEKTKGSQVLVVCETSGAAEKGASINLGIENKKMRFEINKEAAKRCELEISSELLKLAKIVKDEGAQ